MTLMETPATNNTIAFLMASNNEDIAQDLANEITALKFELERVRQIDTDRFERIQAKSIELERVKKIAVDLANEVTALHLELERVKSIAFARLERIQDQVLELEHAKEELERVKELTRKMNAYHEKRAIELEAKLERATLPSDMWDMFDQANA